MVQHTVDAKAHGELVLTRLEMDVRGARLYCLGENAVDIGNDGRVLGQFAQGSRIECLRLGADAFRRLLRVHPELADDFAEVLAERESKLVAARQGFDEQARARHSEARRADLAANIRAFFGLD